VAWEHRRCWGPLEADAKVSARKTGTHVGWNRRSLFSFGEGDLGEFVDANDLIIFDHPFSGEASRRGLLLDLRSFLSQNEIEMLERNRVGASYESYHFENGIWGLPIDTAATVASWRSDLLRILGAEVPNTIDDVFDIANLARKQGNWVAWAAKPTDLFCTYMTMLASLGIEVGKLGAQFCPQVESAYIVDKMIELLGIVHPKSSSWNPIQLYSHMSTNDDVVYSPYAFNYVNYSVANVRSIRFGTAPRMVLDLPARGLLAGAGIGISAKSKHAKVAFEYAMRLIDPKFQATDYVANGGQPGMRSAWTSTECNRLTNGFFSDCLQALDTAFLRPNIPGFVDFFHLGTQRLAHVVYDDGNHRDFWQWLVASYDDLQGKTN
jgi:multiple sugar transport system substrate-binding protein